MRRLVYSPKVYAYVRTDKFPDGLDISDYIVSGNVHRRVNAASTLELELRNPNLIWTAPGFPTFHPMDAITVYLTRLKGYPVQAFTGYLDTADAMVLYPGTIKITASCTLKRLLNTFWDPALPYVQNGFLAKYGWNVNPQTGTLFNSDAISKTLGEASNKQLTDGSMGALLFAILKHVGNWDSQDIYIEALPSRIKDRMTAIYSELASSNDAVKDQVDALLSKLLGPGGYGQGGGSGDTGQASGTVPATPDGGYTEATWAAALLKSLGIQQNNDNMQALVGWEKAEGGHWINDARYNPLNTTEPMPGAGNTGLQGDIKIYTSWSQGLQATVKTLNNGRYGAILKALKNGSVPDIASAIASTPWNPGGYPALFAAMNAAPKDLGGTQVPGAHDDPTDPTTRGAAPDATTKTKNLDKGNWSAAPGANLPGKPMRDPIKQFLSVLAGLTNEQIVVGFGTNHDQFTTSGNVSDHYTGDAADILVGGDARSDSAAASKGDNIATAALRLLGYSQSDARNMAMSGKLNFTQNFDWYGHRVQVGWRTLEGGNHFNHVHVGVAFTGRTIPDDIPADGSGTSSDSTTGGGSSSPTSGGSDTSMASAFAAYLNFPSLEQTAEAIGLQGQKSLMNDQPLFPFVQQVVEASLRNFMSLPNGDFYAFFPDYFGGFKHRTPYWQIDDIEILDGRITLSDESLATHVYVVGDIVPDGATSSEVNFLDKLQSGGVVTMFDAFKGGFVRIPEELKVQEEKGGKTSTQVVDPGTGLAHGGTREATKGELDRSYVIKFLQKYGVRPHYEEAPMVRSPYFEAFLAYQRFQQLWAQQFATTFTFTFMPELFPGGLVAFPDHNLQCYVEEVVHSFDYESGFATQAVLSAPASLTDTGSDVSAGMVRAFNNTGPKKGVTRDTTTATPPNPPNLNITSPNWLQRAIKVETG
ncbi:hypothetical protein [Candidatus Solirubrobacter pratensis]|uniref:hypothetical protein n=1 Tax=Candidatus Solirubrobacter pratensis TaxID=1298857 RepID=UPI00041C3500|nr:hypothetical protein [Candidatus Solirubrobacter pratensis]